MEVWFGQYSTFPACLSNFFAWLIESVTTTDLGLGGDLAGMIQRLHELDAFASGALMRKVAKVALVTSASAMLMVPAGMQAPSVRFKVGSVPRAITPDSFVVISHTGWTLEIVFSE